MRERGIPRHGYEVRLEGEPVAEVTSGSFAPFLKDNIGLLIPPVLLGTALAVAVLLNRLTLGTALVAYALSWLLPGLWWWSQAGVWARHDGSVHRRRDQRGSAFIVDLHEDGVSRDDVRAGVANRQIRLSEQ